jgi:putative DNA primase/helicase
VGPVECSGDSVQHRRATRLAGRADGYLGVSADPIAAFAAALDAAGLHCNDPIIADDRLHRFKAPGDKKADGFYILHLNGGPPAGAFGHWRLHPEKITWHSEPAGSVSSEQRDQFIVSIAAAKAKRDADTARAQTAAAKLASEQFASLKNADPDHPYLVRKGIGTHGLKETKGGRVVVPVLIGGNIISLQSIEADGTKKFLKGSQTAGGYYRLGEEPDGTAYICEGFASAASIREATGATVFAAFGCGNLLAVAKFVHGKYPALEIVLVADNDIERIDPPNPGVTCARKAASAVGARVIIPTLAGAPERTCDINDVHVTEGLAAVRKLIEAEREGPAVITMNSVSAEDVEWLWQPKIAAKKITLVVSDPGLGKSFLSLYTAARMSTAGEWIDGGTAPLGDTLLLSLEDDAADTIRPRLDALGADCSRIHLLTGVKRRIKGKLVEMVFDLSSDLPMLEAALQRYPNVRLVIIDPISAYPGRGGLGGANSHNNAEMRALLTPLGVLAAKYRVAILAISHLNKSASQALYRVQGSLAFVALARATWFVVKDPTNPDRRLLLCSKINVGPDNGPGLAYRIQEDEFGRATIAWEKEPVNQRLEDVLSADVAPKSDPPKLAEAKIFLLEQLADGQRHLSAAVTEAALAHGIKEQTYLNARAAEVKAKHVRVETGEMKRSYLVLVPDAKRQK